MDSGEVQSPSRGREPYIVSKIDGKGLDSSGLFSNRMFPISRAIVDAQRISKYTLSADGLFKMTLMGNVTNSLISYLDGVHKYRAFYNPLSSIFASVSRLVGTTPFAPIGRNFPFDINDKYVGAMFGSLNWKWGSSVDKDIGLGRGLDDENGTLDKSTYVLSEAVTRISSKVTVDSTQTNFKGSKGDPHTVQDIVHLGSEAFPDVGNDISLPLASETADGAKALNKLVDDGATDKGLPFFFKDLRDGSYISFRAYIDALTDSITPSWNETSYVGRSEPVYIYENATREINFGLKLHAGNRHELNMIYKKINRLTSMCYPEYKQDVQITQYKAERMKPPLVQLRLGDLFGSASAMLTGFISSLTYQFPDEGTWEHTVGYRVPKYINVQINYKVIHDEAPSGNRFSKKGTGTGLNFYGINEKAGVG